MRMLRGCLLWLLLWQPQLGLAQTPQPLPTLTAPVTDLTGTLSPPSATP